MCPVTFSYETCGAIDEYTSASYIGKTRDFARLIMLQFMNAPLDVIRTSLPMFEANIISPTNEHILTRYLYTQTVSLQIGTSEIGPYYMIYAGLEDGLFTGYFSPTSYTLRAPSGKTTDISWAPYTLEPSCGDGMDASGATCEVNEIGDGCKVTLGCSFVAGINEVCAASDACTGAKGMRVQPSGTCLAHDAVCVDKNVRNFYTISEAGDGPVAPATTFTRWMQYDPRIREWYTNGKTVWENSKQKLAYSSVYEFGASGELGITATGVLIQNSVFLGILGIDYDLVQISTLLTRVVTADLGGWAYAIERSGPSAGMFVGSTVDNVLRLQPGERRHAKNSAHSSVRESTYLLEPNGWPEGYYQRFDDFGFGAKHHKCYYKLGFESCLVSVEDQFVPWVSTDPSHQTAAGPAHCADVSIPCIKANVDFGADVEGCGYAPMIGIAVDSTSWNPPGDTYTP
jgi:hypothetical protein